MNDDELLSQVRTLREQGDSPKEIARALGLRPSTVIPLVRKIAELQQAGTDPSERELLGCWINPNWSAGLGLDDAPREWAAADPEGSIGADGFASILIARKERASRATLCGFLVDVYCLGVKDVVGPLSKGSGSIDDFRRKYFGGFDKPPISCPLELAQHLVHGGVAYARTLGFEPHPDFAAAAAYLGMPSTPTPIQFGRDGKPFYISGPRDNPRTIMRTLESTVGSGNYDFLAGL